MDYINEYGEVIKIPVSDEVWLDDAFFEREMSKLPLDAPRAGLAYRVSTKGQVDHDDIPMQKIECRKFCVTISCASFGTRAIQATLLRIVFVRSTFQNCKSLI